jgi:hypothetical protein
VKLKQGKEHTDKAVFKDFELRLEQSCGNEMDDKHVVQVPLRAMIRFNILPS